MRPSELHVIYALTEPGDEWDIRYIGATVNPTNRRHSHTAILGRSPRDGWIADLKRRGLRYGFKILASVVGGWHQRSAAEREVIAQYAKERPGRLLNVADRDNRPIGVRNEEYRRRQANSAANGGRDEFQRIARWAIRQCLMNGSLQKPIDKHGWWRFMMPPKYRKRHPRRFRSDRVLVEKLTGIKAHLRSA